MSFLKRWISGCSDAAFRGFRPACLGPKWCCFLAPLVHFFFSSKAGHFLYFPVSFALNDLKLAKIGWIVPPKFPKKINLYFQNGITMDFETKKKSGSKRYPGERAAPLSPMGFGSPDVLEWKGMGSPRG